MMVRPRMVPNVAKAAVLVAMAQVRGRWVRTAELPAPSTAAITSSGIAASAKPVAKWTAEASAKVAASAAIALPVLLLGARRRLGSAFGAGVMVLHGGEFRFPVLAGGSPRMRFRVWRGHLPAGPRA